MKKIVFILILLFSCTAKKKQDLSCIESVLLKRQYSPTPDALIFKALLSDSVSKWVDDDEQKIEVELKIPANWSEKIAFLHHEKDTSCENCRLFYFNSILFFEYTSQQQLDSIAHFAYCNTILVLQDNQDTIAVMPCE